MIRQGWVCLHRKILDSEVFANPDLLRMFVWCLVRASHKQRHVDTTTGRGSVVVTVGPGQFITSREKAARELHLKPSTVYRHWKRLENMGVITIQADRHWSIITLVNWSTYQPQKRRSGQANGQTSDRLRTGFGQTSGANNNAENADNGQKGEPSRADHRCVSWEEARVRAGKQREKNCTRRSR